MRQDAAPKVYDANHLQPQLGVALDLDRVFDFFEETLGDLAHRHVITGPGVDPALASRLALEDYRPSATWQGLLRGELQGPPPPRCEIRPVEGEADWARLGELVRANHVETDARTGGSIFSPEVTEQMQSVRRLASDEAHFFMLWDDAAPVAFFSSWPGVDGVGMVEDLFTLPSHRERGLARALIHHCVADARARGARSVLIGAEIDDTPKQIYAAIGFEPTCLTWSWVKQPA